MINQCDGGDTVRYFDGVKESLLSVHRYKCTNRQGKQPELFYGLRIVSTAASKRKNAGETPQPLAVVSPSRPHVRLQTHQPASLYQHIQLIHENCTYQSTSSMAALPTANKKVVWKKE